MAREKLSPEDVRERLAGLAGWELAAQGRAIRRAFTFRNFSEAFAFMTRVAMDAERMDHHPDWSNTYRTVEVTLSTHSASGLTELDFELARKMNGFAGG